MWSVRFFPKTADEICHIITRNWLIFGQFTSWIDFVVSDIFGRFSFIKKDDIGFDSRIGEKNPCWKADDAVDVIMCEQLFFNFCKGVGGIEQDSLWDNDRCLASGFEFFHKMLEKQHLGRVGFDREI